MSEVSLPTAPVASRAERPTSFDLAAFPMPGGREEEWRFTPLKRLAPVLADVLDGAAPQLEVAGQALGQAPAKLAPGVNVSTVADLPAQVGAPSDRAAVVAWNNAPQATLLEVEAGAEVADPVIIDVIAGPSAAGQRLVVKAGANSAATVVLTHRGPARLAQTVEVVVERDAQLNLVAIHEWDDDAVHTSNHRISVDSGATLQHMTVTLGGDAVRICPEVEFVAKGGDVNLLGLYYTGQGQHQEARLFVHHGIESCKSRVTYKGVLQGQAAHSVWIGDVLIGPDAFGTDTYELNRNLVLGKGPKADSVPNLEIQNGMIEGAGHASATGRFDDDQLFYLKSRGIPEAEARRLVIRAFFAELINELGVEAIQDHLMEVIEKKLQSGGQA